MRKQFRGGAATVSVTAFVTTIILALGLLSTPAQAVPVLQLYIEGSVYDEETESWVLEPAEGESAPDSLRLWAIGAVGKWDGSPIEDVRLAIAYSSQFGELDFVFDATNTGGLGGFYAGSDPEPISDPSDPAKLRFVSDDPGTTPQLSDGSDLPSHGLYTQDNLAWQEFSLGDFTETNYHLADFIDDFDDLEPNANHTGQIKAYEISIFGSTVGVDRFHFDLYNSKPAGQSGKAQAWFAPFSHNADGNLTVVPSPSAIGGGLIGLAGLLGLRGNRRRQRSGA